MSVLLAMIAGGLIVAIVVLLQRGPQERVTVIPAGPSVWAEVDRLLAEGKKIAAIKAYREGTGAALKQARDAVDAREAGHTPRTPLPSAREIDAQWRHRIDQAIGAGRELEAIKFYREATGADLQEAHDAILYWERLQ